MVKIETVGVVGCGLMGSGIAEVIARAGKQVIVREVEESALEAGRKRIVTSLDRAVEREKLAPEERERAWDRIRFTTRLEELADRDLVIEAVIEELAVKNEVFGTLDRLAPEETIFATNTSSLPVTEMASRVQRPDRMVGLHFFNPVPVMKLVELVRTIETSDETYQRVLAFARSLGKEPVSSRDTSGFLVNLLLVPFVLDAIRQVERGMASIEDIDTAMVLGLGHPMGPLTLCDFVGIDTFHRISEIMYEEYREVRYAPPPLLKRMVVMRRYGRKSGRGFYDYTGDEPVPIPI